MGVLHANVGRVFMGERELALGMIRHPLDREAPEPARGRG
jgi:hypothetical protein